MLKSSGPWRHLIEESLAREALITSIVSPVRMRFAEPIPVSFTPIRDSKEPIPGLAMLIKHSIGHSRSGLDVEEM